MVQTRQQLREKRKRAQVNAKLCAWGYGTYGHVLFIRQDGSVACFGDNSAGEAPPEGLEGDFVKVSAGMKFSVALRRDGSIVFLGTGSYESERCNTGATQNLHRIVVNDFIDIAAGQHHSLAIRRDGRIVCWGNNRWDQAPDEVAGKFVAISAGFYHSLAIREDGYVVCWGTNTWSQAPPEVPGDFVAVAAGFYHSFALRRDGVVVSWGLGRNGVEVMESLRDVIAIVASRCRMLALRRDGAVIETLTYDGPSPYTRIHVRVEDYPTPFTTRVWQTVEAYDAVALGSDYENFRVALRRDGVLQQRVQIDDSIST